MVQKGQRYRVSNLTFAVQLDVPPIVFIQQQASRYLTRVKKHYTAAAEGKQHWRLGEWLQNSSIFRERGKESRMSRTAAAEQCCFLGDGKCVFRFILKGSLLLYGQDHPDLAKKKFGAWAVQ